MEEVIDMRSSDESENSNNEETEQELSSESEIEIENDFENDFDLNEFINENENENENNQLIQNQNDQLNQKNLNQKLPSRKELSQIKENQEILYSNIYKIQIELLLKKIGLDYKKKTQDIKEYLFELKNKIDGIENIKFQIKKNQITINQLQKSQQNQKQFIYSFKKSNFPNLKLSNDTLRMNILKPSNTYLIGSFLTESLVKPYLNIDVGIEIPSDVFEQEDIFDYKYHDKRAIYLHLISQYLQYIDPEQFTNANMHFSFFKGNRRKPILVIKPGFINIATENNTKSEKQKKRTKRKKERLEKRKTKFVIRIIPMISQKTFDINKLSLESNNLKKNSNQNSTPFYNNSILEDMFFYHHLETIHETITNSKSISEGILLIKEWLHKRKLYSYEDGISGFLASIILVFLIYKKRVIPSMTSYQVFRLFLEFFNKSDELISQGIIIDDQNRKIQEKDKLILQSFRKHFDIVILDEFKACNLAAHFKLSSFYAIKEDARITLDLLRNGENNRSLTILNFQNIFLIPTNLNLKYDGYITISSIENFKKKAKKIKYQDCGFENYFKRKIYRILQKGYGNRISSLAVFKPNEDDYGVCNIQESMKNHFKSKFSLIIGINLNPENCFKIVDRGPEADDQIKAAKFRKLWGKLSELRRFTDGSILEAVAWEKYTEKQESIPRAIAEFLLAHHFGLEVGKHFHFIGDKFSKLIKIQKMVIRSGFQGKKKTVLSHYHQICELVISSFQKISQNMKELDELPLDIISIQPLSDIFSQTSIDVNKPIEFKLEFETSAKWPDNIQAIKHLKIAFLIEISKGLEKYHKINSKISLDYLDVFTNSGFVLRFFLSNGKENDLLEKNRPQDYKEIEKKILFEPNHRDFITQNFTKKNQIYPELTRLCKQWIHSNYLSDYFSNELIEILVGYLFSTSNIRYSQPNSLYSGFLRFLDFMINFEFQNFPIILDPNHILSAQDLEKIDKQFQSLKNKVPIYVSTSQYPIGTRYTSENPTKLIMKRMQKIAQKTLNELLSIFETQEITNKELFNQIQKIFQVQITDFDLIIKLKNSRLIRKKLEKNGIDFYSGFSPKEKFLQELNNKLGFAILFFHNQMELDSEIGIVFKPSSFLPKEFKLSDLTSINCAIPTKIQEDNLITIPNIFEIISSIWIIGEGIIESIESNFENKILF